MSVSALNYTLERRYAAFSKSQSFQISHVRISIILIKNKSDARAICVASVADKLELTDESLV